MKQVFSSLLKKSSLRVTGMAFGAYSVSDGASNSDLLSSALTHFQQGSFKESLKQFEQAATQQPLEKPLLMQYGISLYYAGLYQEAANQFRTGEASTEAAIWSYLCDVQTMGAQKARKQFMPVELSPDTPALQKAAYNAFLSGVDGERILRVASKSAADSDQVMGNFYYGLFQELQGHHEEAQQFLSQAAKSADSFVSAISHFHLFRLEQIPKSVVQSESKGLWHGAFDSLYEYHTPERVNDLANDDLCTQGIESVTFAKQSLQAPALNSMPVYESTVKSTGGLFFADLMVSKPQSVSSVRSTGMDALCLDGVQGLVEQEPVFDTPVTSFSLAPALARKVSEKPLFQNAVMNTGDMFFGHSGLKPVFRHNVRTIGMDANVLDSVSSRVPSFSFSPATETVCESVPQPSQVDASKFELWYSSHLRTASGDSFFQKLRTVAKRSAAPLFYHNNVTPEGNIRFYHSTTQSFPESPVSTAGVESAFSNAQASRRSSVPSDVEIFQSRIHSKGDSFFAEISSA